MTLVARSRPFTGGIQAILPPAPPAARRTSSRHQGAWPGRRAQNALIKRANFEQGPAKTAVFAHQLCVPLSPSGGGASPARRCAGPMALVARSRPFTGQSQLAACSARRLPSSHQGAWPGRCAQNARIKRANFEQGPAKTAVFVHQLCAPLSPSGGRAGPARRRAAGWPAGSSGHVVRQPPGPKRASAPQGACRICAWARANAFARGRTPAIARPERPRLQGASLQPLPLPVASP